MIVIVRVADLSASSSVGRYDNFEYIERYLETCSANNIEHSRGGRSCFGLDELSTIVRGSPESIPCAGNRLPEPQAFLDKEEDRFGVAILFVPPRHCFAILPGIH
jgi:hypothetical protein